MEMEWKRRGAIAGIVIGVIAGYRYLLAVFLPFIAAWILAGWLYPLTAKIEKKIKIKKSVTGAVLLTLLSALAGFLLYLSLRELSGQLRTALSRLPALRQMGGTFLNGCCRAVENTVGISAPDLRNFLLARAEALREQAFSLLGPRTFAAASSMLRGCFFFASGLVVTFISTLLILGDMEDLRKKILDYSWLVGARHVLRNLQKTTITYLKAQAVIMAVVAGVCALGFWALKSPYFLIFGLILGLLDALPLIGTGTFLYPAAVVFLIRGRVIPAAGCVLLDIVTSVLREFLEPRLLGEKLGVSPVLILASVYLGIFLYGVWGVILGPLSFSTIYEIGREWDIWGE